MADETRKVTDIMADVGRVFTKFPKLPFELRLIIWKLALPNDARIVEIEREDLKVTVGEWNWEGAPANPTREERIKHYMEEDNHGVRRINKMVGHEWLDAFYYDSGREDGQWERCFYDEAHDEIMKHRMAGFRSLRPSSLQIQSFMAVCRESNQVASQVYSKAFATCGAFPETLFDFRQDTLYIRFAKGLIWDSPDFDESIRPYFSRMDGESLAKLKYLAIGVGRDVLDFLEEHMYRNMWEVASELLVYLLTIFTDLEDLTLVIDVYYFSPQFDDAEPYVFIDPDQYDDCWDSDRPTQWNSVYPDHLKFDSWRKDIHLNWSVFSRGKPVEEERKSPTVHYKFAIPLSYSDRLEELRKERRLVAVSDKKTDAGER